MLATLDKGVIGGKWYSLIDKLYPETTLRAAFKAVAVNRGAAGVDHVSIEDYAENLDANLARLSEALRTGSYRPQAIRRHYIPKQGSQEKRLLGIPTVPDRVVRTALRMVIEPIPRAGPKARLLRKQQKPRGIAKVRGADQTRWPNAFFAGHGLFSLHEVAPVSWTPAHLCSRSPRCRSQEEPTPLSSVASWSSWWTPAARPRSWHASSNRRRSRSGTGWRKVNTTRDAAMAA
jgi:hypothetical protein